MVKHKIDDKLADSYNQWTDGKITLSAIKSTSFSFKSMYSGHFVTCVTMKMLNSVYNPYPESKKSQYINIYNKTEYTIIYCLMSTLIKMYKDDQW